MPTGESFPSLSSALPGPTATTCFFCGSGGVFFIKTEKENHRGMSVFDVGKKKLGNERKKVGSQAFKLI